MSTALRAVALATGHWNAQVKKKKHPIFPGRVSVQRASSSDTVSFGRQPPQTKKTCHTQHGNSTVAQGSLQRARPVFDDTEENATHSVVKRQCQSSGSRRCCPMRWSSKSSCVAEKTCSRSRRHSLRNWFSLSHSLWRNMLHFHLTCVQRPSCRTCCGASWSQEVKS